MPAALAGSKGTPSPAGRPAGLIGVPLHPEEGYPGKLNVQLSQHREGPS